jgi:AmiR/NasT family two-component response regulator
MEIQKKVLVISQDCNTQGSLNVLHQVSKRLDLEVMASINAYAQFAPSIAVAMPDLIVCDVSASQSGASMGIVQQIYQDYPIPVFFLLPNNSPELLEQTEKFTVLGLMLKPLNPIQFRLSLRLSLVKAGLLIT